MKITIAFIAGLACTMAAGFSLGKSYEAMGAKTRIASVLEHAALRYHNARCTDDQQNSVQH